MEKIKHTPGPWIVDSERAGVSRTCQVTADGVTIAYVPMQRAANGFYTDGTDVANACLIAAAPEMWETLEAVERWAHGEGIELSPTLKRRMNEIRAKVLASESESA